MLQSIRKTTQAGFTIIELLIVIAIIGILALLVLNNFQGAQAKARDSQRTTDTNAIHAKLEEFYNQNSYYPAANLTTTILPGMDAGALTDADGADIAETYADQAGAPTAPTMTTTNEYAYAAYGTGCASGAAVGCAHYTLYAFSEKGSNPYTKASLN